MIDEEDVYVYYIENAPAGFHGCVHANDDGSYSVFLDPNDTFERRLKTYKHEMKHIKNDDFNKEKIQEIEHNSHT